MNERVKTSGMSLKGLIAGGLLAGAVGLGYGGGDYSHPSTGTGAAKTSEDHGIGGSKGPGMSQAALPPNVAPGWKIRVCSEKTKAQSIEFRAYPANDKAAKKASKQTPEGTGTTGMNGTGGAGDLDPATTATSASWSQGENSVVPLSESLAKVEKIKIEAIPAKAEATPAQKDLDSEVCVLYNDHVTKKISFDDRSETTVKMSETGSCGC